MPAQLVLHPSALDDQIPAVVDQQLDLPGGAVELGGGQIVVPQRGQPHRLGIDRIGLARLPAATASAGHQPGRHPDHPMTGGQQVLLQAAGQMPAVFEREAHLRPLRRPGHQRQMPVAGSGDGLLAETTTDRVEGDDGVRALV